MQKTAIAAAASVLLAATAAQAGDAAKGKTVFQRCAICHTVTKGGGNGLGPNLFGVVGRKAGMASGFSYSVAMKNSGITWTPDKLLAYVQHPAQLVPANRMAFAGLGDPAQANDVVAYLATLK
jgi:cytochrome c